MPDDLTVDLDARDLVFDSGEEGLELDLEDRDFVLDPRDGDISIEFGAVGLPGASDSADPGDLTLIFDNGLV